MLRRLLSKALTFVPMATGNKPFQIVSGCRDIVKFMSKLAAFITIFLQVLSALKLKVETNTLASLDTTN